MHRGARGLRADGLVGCDAVGDTRCVTDGPAPSAETCNGADDDCDGVTDEVDGIGAPCEAGVGACRAEGARACVGDGLACVAPEGAPDDERCNAVDDDCDGAVDELDGVGDGCAAGLGACRVEGVVRCDLDRGAPACDAVAAAPGAVEWCGDGVDDDCDGATDEAPCSVACGGDGDCAGGGCIDGACGEPERCDDGVDNDSDGAVDCADESCVGVDPCGPCGDGVIDPGEGCDDGGLRGGDGCDAACAVEPGFVCVPAAPGPSRCRPSPDCGYAFDGEAIEAPFETDGDAPWRVVEGAATSGRIGNGGRSVLRLVVEVPVGGEVRFRRRVSSEQCCDGLRFTIDAIQANRWRGELGWAPFAFALAPGVRVLEWTYAKDDTLDEGSDRAQIDDLVIVGAVGLCAAE